MNYIRESAFWLARASNGNPVISVFVVGIFFVWFNVLLAVVERLIFGERFEHWLDPVFGLCFMAYAAYSVFACAAHNSQGQQS